jgi:hypothetical protein
MTCKASFPAFGYSSCRRSNYFSRQHVQCSCVEAECCAGPPRRKRKSRCRVQPQRQDRCGVANVCAHINDVHHGTAGCVEMPNKARECGVIKWIVANNMRQCM